MRTTRSGTSPKTQTEDQTKAAFQGVATSRFSSIGIRHRGRLPHWEREGGLYFVTFRTADSLPKKMLQETRARLRMSGKSDHLRQRAFEKLMDSAAGSCPFKNEQCASVVADALRGLHGQCRLLAWCVMPNHVHFVARLLPGMTLSRVMHSLKSYSAKRINRLMNKTGPVWEREYYDRLIRDSDELQRAISYILRNTEKAGLKGWRWVEDIGNHGG